LQTVRYRINYDAEMGTANSLHASA